MKAIIRIVLINFLLLISSLGWANNFLARDFEKVKQIFSQKKHDNLRLLFIQLADAGEVAPAKQHSGCAWLRLNHLHQQILFFSDQPKRVAGRLTVQQFLQVWQHNQIRPNVALEAYAVRNHVIQRISYIATFSEPTYDASQHTVRYLICPLNTKQQQLPSKLSAVDLFFDRFHPWPP